MTGNLDVFQLLMGLAGGLALFLFGMEQMASSLKAATGERMKTVLARLTTNRFTSALTGAFVTAIIQSSSVTTVLVVGFISAGLMSLSQSIGIIMGANIGTTITAQVIAFKVTKYALLLIAVGFGLLFAGKQDKIREYGGMIMGLGLIFFGMAVMSDAMSPLRSYQPFLDLMVEMENPLFGILLGAVFTALVQSSSATTGIVIVLASQGFIALSVGIALAFGANIGTCVTALLGAIGKPREALRAAVVHVLFNVMGVLVWIGLIDQLAGVVTQLSPVAEGLQGLDKLAAETPRQIANAHTIFNIANTLLFIGFTVPMARLVERLVPDKPLVFEAAVVKPRYLSQELVSTPSLALNAARLEMAELGSRVQAMLEAILPETLSGTKAGLDRVAGMDTKVDQLHGAIIAYLHKVGAGSLTDQESATLFNLMETANIFENMGDIIETDMVTLGRRRIDEKVTVSDSTRDVLLGVQSVVARAVELAVEAVSKDDVEAAHKVMSMKALVNRMSERAMRRGSKRLIGKEPHKVRAYTREMEIIEKLKRIYYFAKRVAKTVAEADDDQDWTAIEPFRAEGDEDLESDIESRR